jgi:hypothetical protein
MDEDEMKTTELYKSQVSVNNFLFLPSFYTILFDLESWGPHNSEDVSH